MVYTRFKDIVNGVIELNADTLRINYTDSILTFKDYNKISIWESTRIEFRSPAEHRINGKSFAAEMHMHFRGQQFPGEVAILSLLFETSDDTEPNKFFESLKLNELQKPQSVASGLSVSLSELFGSLSKNEKYHYLGSLTKPP